MKNALLLYPHCGNDMQQSVIFAGKRFDGWVTLINDISVNWANAVLRPDPVNKREAVPCLPCKWSGGKFPDQVLNIHHQD